MKIIPIPLSFGVSESIYETNMGFKTADVNSAVLQFTGDIDPVGCVATLTMNNETNNANRVSTVLEQFDVEKNPFDYLLQEEIQSDGVWLGEITLKRNLITVCSQKFRFAIGSSLQQGVIGQLVKSKSLDELVMVIREDVMEHLGKNDLSVKGIEKYVNEVVAKLLLGETNRNLNEEERKLNEITRKTAFEVWSQAVSDLIDQGVIDQRVQAIIEEFQSTYSTSLFSLSQQLEQTSAQVDLLNRGLGETFATLVALQTTYPTGDTKDHIVGADGHRYYWSGSAWADGGAYQAVELVSDSVHYVSLDTKLRGVLNQKDRVVLTSHQAWTNVADITGDMNKFATRYPVSTNYITKIKTFLEVFSISTQGVVSVTCEIWNGTFTAKLAEATVNVTSAISSQYISFDFNDVDVSLHTDIYVVVKVPDLTDYRIGIPYASIGTSSANSTYNNKYGTTYNGNFNNVANINTYPIPCVIYDTDLILKRPPNVIVVSKDGSGDYGTIQDAVDNCGDSASNPVTILLMPGAHERFTCRINGSTATLRYISIVGVNKQECIIFSKEGDYLKPPAEIKSNGIFKNLTFKATHENGTKTIEIEQRMYAMHADYWTQNPVFEDCIFESDCGPAIGIGLAPDTTMTFKRCDFKSTADNTYGTNTLGAFFGHTATFDGVANQKIILEDCDCTSLLGTVAAKFSVMNTTTGTTKELMLKNNLFWNDAYNNSAISVDAGFLSQKSFGNNSPTANYTA